MEYLDKLKKLNATRNFIQAFVQGNHQCCGSILACTNDGNDECIACGERDCPHGEPLHYHHDGCPACVFDEENSG